MVGVAQKRKKKFSWRGLYENEKRNSHGGGDTKTIKEILMVGVTQKQKKEILMVGVAQKRKKKFPWWRWQEKNSHGGGGPKTKKEILMVEVAQKRKK
jgi:hypothetical protein